MSSTGTLLGMASLVAACLAIGCGPSPAMQPSSPVRVVRVPAEHVVEACPCDHEVEVEEDEVAVAAPQVEYVRIDEWQPPPSVRELESRIEPRGDKPPEYVQLPRLTMHKDISNTTIYRRSYYWR